MDIRGPDFAVSNRVLAKLAEMQLKDISCTVVFEAFLVYTTQTIPNGTMAFNRTGRATVLIMLRWDNMVSNRSREAREVAHEIAGSKLGGKSLVRDP